MSNMRLPRSSAHIVYACAVLVRSLACVNHSMHGIERTLSIME
jgi:hypothetical protein